MVEQKPELLCVETDPDHYELIQLNLGNRFSLSITCDPANALEIVASGREFAALISADIPLASMTGAEFLAAAIDKKPQYFGYAILFTDRHVPTEERDLLFDSGILHVDKATATYDGLIAVLDRITTQSKP